MKPDDLRDQHIIDQALAESIELGMTRITGKNAQGDDEIQLTAKGVANVVIMLLGQVIEKANQDKRDFTSGEKLFLLEHIETLRKSLQK